MEGSLSTGADQVSVELSELSMYGDDLIWSFGEVLATGIIYGVHVVLTLAATTILWRRKGGIKRARLILGASVVILFLLATADLCCTMVYIIVGVRNLLVNNAGTPFTIKNNAYLDKYHTLMEIHSVLFPVAFVIGDAIVVWRACTLSGRNKRIIILLMVFQVAAIGAAFGWIGCFVTAGMPFETDVKCRPVFLATYALSIAINIVATTVIGYTTWSNWKAIQEYLKLSYQPVRAERVTVLLMESGLFYAFLLIIQLLLEVIPNPDSTEYRIAAGIFWKISTLLVGIYPTALIVLIFLERSLWDTDGVPSSHLGSTGALELGPSYLDPRQVNLECVNSHTLHPDHPMPGNGPLPVLFVTEKSSNHE
ncbi:hypothetical protein PM082_000020 [Marasmius tenuissimus]|nr:hypothetical protein PM082_000020 [Marasmius tenuissimus]